MSGVDEGLFVQRQIGVGVYVVHKNLVFGAEALSYLLARDYYNLRVL